MKYILWLVGFWLKMKVDKLFFLYNLQVNTWATEKNNIRNSRYIEGWSLTLAKFIYET